MLASAATVSTRRTYTDLARRRRARRIRVGVLAALVLQVVAWWLIVHYFKTRRIWYGFFDVSDIGLYESYASRFAAGLRLYDEVLFEYPPLAAPLMLVPRLLGRYLDYRTAFATEMAILCAAVAAVTGATAGWLGRGLGRPIATALAFAVITLLGGPLIANRFDIAVGLDIALAAYCMARRSFWWAGVVLGLGFALKLTPALLLPLVLLVAPKPRQAVLALLAFGLAAGMAFLPHVLRSGRAILYVFTYHSERPLQIESLYSTPFLLARAWGKGAVVIGNSHGSQSLIAAGAETAARASMWVMAACLVALYGLLWLRRHRLRSSPSDFALAALGVLLIFECTSKVLSPQYMMWAFPLVALVCTSPRLGSRGVGCMLLAAMLLTQVEFPSRYWDLVALHRGPIVLMAARNLILLSSALAVVLLLVLRGPRASRRRDDGAGATEMLAQAALPPSH